MTEHSVDLHIPADFILQRLLLTPAEIKYGYRHGWIGDSDVVAIELARMKAGLSLSAEEEELALLLSDETDRVGTVMEELPGDPDGPKDVAAVWVFLAIAWVDAHPELFLDRSETVDLLYSDFDYPEDMAGLVGWTPLAPGEQGSPALIERRWVEYLRTRGAKFRARDQ